MSQQIVETNDRAFFGSYRFGLLNTVHCVYLSEQWGGGCCGLMERFSTVSAQFHLGETSIKSSSLLKLFKFLVKLFLSRLVRVPKRSLVRCLQSVEESTLEDNLSWVLASSLGLHEGNFGSWSPFCFKDFWLQSNFSLPPKLIFSPEREKKIITLWFL